jgi:hypothetical protein
VVSENPFTLLKNSIQQAKEQLNKAKMQTADSISQLIPTDKTELDTFMAKDIRYDIFKTLYEAEANVSKERDNLGQCIVDRVLERSGYNRK